MARTGSDFDRTVGMDADPAVDLNPLVDAGDDWATPIGKLLAAARQEFAASRGGFLNRDDLAREWAEQRAASRSSDE